MNKTIKKIVAVAAIGVFGMSSIAAAHALDLSNYPAPFINNGAFVGKIVIGENAKAIDTVGALDIAASLQRDASMATSTSGTVTTTNGKVEDIPLGDTFNKGTHFGTKVDDTDLPFLKRDQVSIDIGENSETYDYHEEIRMPSGATTENLTARTGLSTGYQSEDWKDRIFVPVKSKSIGYYYVFDSVLKADTMIANATTNDPITINFLGKDLKITSASATSMTVQVGSDYFMNVGDTVTVNGKQVKLINVANSASTTGGTVVVSVDGQQKTVSGTLNVNGLRIKVDNTFYADQADQRSATLVIGDQATKTYNDGDEYIGEDKDNPAWRWSLAGLGTATPTIGIYWDLNLYTQTQTDNPAYGHPLYVGDSIKFPNGFADLKFDSVNQQDYVTYDVTHDTHDLYNYVNDTSPLILGAEAIKLTAQGLTDTGFIVGSHKADTIWLYASSN